MHHAITPQFKAGDFATVTGDIAKLHHGIEYGIIVQIRSDCRDGDYLVHVRDDALEWREFYVCGNDLARLGDLLACYG